MYEKTYDKVGKRYEEGMKLQEKGMKRYEKYEKHENHEKPEKYNKYMKQAGKAQENRKKTENSYIQNDKQGFHRNPSSETVVS